MEKAVNTASFAVEAGTILGMVNLMSAKAIQGAMYSAGGETFAAERNFGSVFTKSDMHAPSMKNTVRFGAGINQQITRRGLFGLDIMTRARSAENAFTISGGGKLAKGGLQKLTGLSVGFPVAMTVLGAMHAGATEGSEGVRDFFIQDVFANYYGMRESNVISTIRDSAKVETAFDLKSGALADFDQGKVSQSKTFAYSTIAGRLMPTMGGYAGAMMGMQVGRTIGEFSAGAINSATGLNVSEGVTGFVGSVFGAAAGAKAGSYLFGSPLKMIAGGLAMIGGHAIQSATADALKSGFFGIGKAKGLSFASDISAYQTRNAVTMRQRALQAMHKSGMNARSAFGQEANIVHMNRDMFSHYKR